MFVMFKLARSCMESKTGDDVVVNIDRIACAFEMRTEEWEDYQGPYVQLLVNGYHVAIQGSLADFMASCSNARVLGA